MRAVARGVLCVENIFSSSLLTESKLAPYLEVSAEDGERLHVRSAATYASPRNHEVRYLDIKNTRCDHVVAQHRHVWRRRGTLLVNCCTQKSIGRDSKRVALLVVTFDVVSVFKHQRAHATATAPLVYMVGIFCARRQHLGLSEHGHRAQCLCVEWSAKALDINRRTDTSRTHPPFSARSCFRNLQLTQ